MNTNQEIESKADGWNPETDRVPAVRNSGPSTTAALALPIIRAFFLVAVATILVLTVFGKLQEQSPGITRSPAPKPPSVDATERAVNQVVTHLIARRLEDGGLRDRTHLNSEMAETDSVNAFRHCLSLHALCNSVNDLNREQIMAELSPLAGWIIEKMLTPLDSRSDILGLRSPSAKDRSELTLRLSAMGLVALSETHRLNPEIVDVDDLKKLGSFVKFMQRRDGGFYDACRIDKGNLVHEGGEDWSEANLAGLACFSLVNFYEIDGDRQWLERADLGIRHIADGMRDRDSFNTDDWFPVVVRSFAPHVEQLEDGIRPATLDECCRKMAIGIISKYPDLRAGGAVKVATREIARSTRALSALIAVLNSTQDERLRRGLQSYADRGIAFLTARQINHGAQLGGFSRSSGTGLEHSRSRAGEVRIDYASYSLLALNSYLNSKAR
jgi:hypothetical protein